jgi:hypothetical protein
LKTFTHVRSLSLRLQPGLIVHVNDVSLLHKELRHKRRYAMVGYPTLFDGLIVIEIIPMTHTARGAKKASFFDSNCGRPSYLCFGLTTFLTPCTFDGTRVRVTSHFVPDATEMLARHSSMRATSALSLAG